jgi:hypothetical protein
MLHGTCTLAVDVNSVHHSTTLAIIVSDTEGRTTAAGAPRSWNAVEVAMTRGALRSWLVHLVAGVNGVISCNTTIPTKKLQVFSTVLPPGRCREWHGMMGFCLCIMCEGVVVMMCIL